MNPAVAIISVGARNAYGHPSPETLARLAAAGAAVYRTDRDGAVMLDTDGRSLTVSTWASGRRDRYCLEPERGLLDRTVRRGQARPRGVARARSALESGHFETTSIPREETHRWRASTSTI